MPSLECPNPFKVRKHGRRRDSLTSISEHCYKKWYPIVQNGDKLCATCRKYCYEKNPEDFASSTEVTGKIQLTTTVSRHSNKENEQWDNATSVSYATNKSVFTIDDAVDYVENIDDDDNDFCDNQSDDEYLMEKNEHRQMLLPRLNALLDFFEIEEVTSMDIEIPHMAEKKIDLLSKNLKSLLVRNYCSEKSDEVDYIKKEEFYKELKGAFKKATTNSEKLHVLTAIPLSVSAYEIERNMNCSIHLARKARKLHEQEGMLSRPSPRTRTSVITEEMKDVAISFYLEDDISRPCPGSYETKLVREEGKKVKLQRRLLMFNLKEVYGMLQMYCAKKGLEFRLGFTYFCMLRPDQCILVSDSKGIHNVCVCIHHQNPTLLVEGSKMTAKSLKIDYDENLPQSAKDILIRMTCEKPSENCFLSKCSKCPGLTNVLVSLKNYFEKNGIKTVNCKQWETVEQKCDLVKHEYSVNDYLVKLEAQIKDKLLEHDFIAKSQSDYVRTRRQNLKEYEAMAIGDFAQNYTTFYQDQVQGSYWNGKQITIHPFAIYLEGEEKIDIDSFIVISENTKHDIYAVLLFRYKLIDYLKSKYGERIKKIIYVSDGAGSQYKNKSNFLTLADHYNTHGIEAEWHFFASCHGKSACDGLGGTVKRLARNATLKNANVDISCAQKLYEWARVSITGMSFAYCTLAEHAEIEKKLSSRLKEAQRIDGTLGFHSFIPVDKKNNRQIIVRRTSHSTEFSIKTVQKKCK